VSAPTPLGELYIAAIGDLERERALADDLAAVIRQMVIGFEIAKIPLPDEIEAVLARYREARGPVAIDDANVRDQRQR
jgi:hypothetical protein